MDLRFHLFKTQAFWEVSEFNCTLKSEYKITQKTFTNKKTKKFIFKRINSGLQFSDTNLILQLPKDLRPVNEGGDLLLKTVKEFIKMCEKICCNKIKVDCLLAFIFPSFRHWKRAGKGCWLNCSAYMRMIVPFIRSSSCSVFSLVWNFQTFISGINNYDNALWCAMRDDDDTWNMFITNESSNARVRSSLAPS